MSPLLSRQCDGLGYWESVEGIQFQVGSRCSGLGFLAGYHAYQARAQSRVHKGYHTETHGVRSLLCYVLVCDSQEFIDSSLDPDTDPSLVKREILRVLATE